LLRAVVSLHPEGEQGEAIKRLVPFVRGQNKIEGKATAYVCENYGCQLPTTEISEMMTLIEV